VRTGAAGIEIDLETIQQRLRLAIHARPVDECAPAAWFASEEDVFSDRHLLHESQFLINHRQPGLLGVIDRFKACFDTIHLKSSFIAAMRMNAGEQLDERALARAVFTAQRVDFACRRSNDTSLSAVTPGKRLVMWSARRIMVLVIETRRSPCESHP
jgi:hypothetical protein